MVGNKVSKQSVAHSFGEGMAAKTDHGRAVAGLSKSDRRKIRALADKMRRAREGCACRTVVTIPAPHPKYGERVPYFTSEEVDDMGCPHRRPILEEVIKATAKMGLSPDVLDGEPQTPQEATETASEPRQRGEST